MTRSSSERTSQGSRPPIQEFDLEQRNPRVLLAAARDEHAAVRLPLTRRHVLRGGVQGAVAISRIRPHREQREALRSRRHCRVKRRRNLLRSASEDPRRGGEDAAAMPHAPSRPHRERVRAKAVSQSRKNCGESHRAADRGAAEGPQVEAGQREVHRLQKGGDRECRTTICTRRRG